MRLQVKNDELAQLPFSLVEEAARELHMGQYSSNQYLPFLRNQEPTRGGLGVIFSSARLPKYTPQTSRSLIEDLKIVCKTVSHGG